MSLLKKLAGLAVGAAAVGAAVYVLQNREHHDDEYEHIWGSEDEVEPETDDDASAVAEPAPAAAPEEPAVPAEEEKPEESAEVEEAPAPKAADYDTPNVNPVELGHTEAPRTADGKIDRIILTGGLAHSKYVAAYITKKVSFIAPVEVMAGGGLPALHKCHGRRAASPLAAAP